MLSNPLLTMDVFLEMLSQTNMLAVYAILGTITSSVLIYIILRREDLGAHKSIFLIFIIPVILICIPSYVAYRYREDVTQHSILTMELVFFSEDLKAWEQSEGKIDRIEVSSEKNGTQVKICGLSYPEKTQMEINGRISGHNLEFDIDSGIQEILFMNSNVIERIKKDKRGSFTLPAHATGYKSLIIELPSIFLKNDFGLYLDFSSSFSIEEVSISFENYIPVYFADGRLSGISSVTFLNEEPQNYFGRYIWLRRVTLSIPILIAVFSIMLSCLYFLLSNVLGLKISGLSALKSDTVSLKNEFDKIRQL